MSTNNEHVQDVEKTNIGEAIHDVIGWALTKDFDLLFSVVAQDADFFIFHPDSNSTIVGFDAFKSFAERNWTDPAFKATRYEIKELRIHLSDSGSVAWYSCFLDDYGEWNGRESGWANVRWTGVLEKRSGKWVITQMHFSFPTDRKYSNHDPWVKVKTQHGLPADQVISALQKEIRRGNTENAVMLAYEMIVTNPDLEDFLWRRLMVISVEDIGFGDTNAPVLIHSLCQLAEKQDRGSGDRMLFAIHAVRFLCGCLKDRSSDEMLNWVKRAVEKQGEWPVIPDYALDMHTEKGRAMGRGKKHFYHEGAKISPELTDRELTYLNRIMELIDKGEMT